MNGRSSCIRFGLAETHMCVPYIRLGRHKCEVIAIDRAANIKEKYPSRSRHALLTSGHCIPCLVVKKRGTELLLYFLCSEYLNNNPEPSECTFYCKVIIYRRMRGSSSQLNTENSSWPALESHWDNILAAHSPRLRSNFEFPGKAPGYAMAAPAVVADFHSSCRNAIMQL